MPKRKFKPKSKPKSLRGAPTNIRFTKFKTVTIEGDKKTLDLIKRQGFSAKRIGNRIQVRIPIEGKYRKPVEGGYKWYVWRADIDQIIHAENKIRSISQAWRGDLHKGPFKWL